MGRLFRSWSIGARSLGAGSLDAGKGRRNRRGQGAGRRGSPRNTPLTMLETLEQRAMLSATVDDAGVLTIVGTERRDVIEVRAGSVPGSVVLRGVADVPRDTVFTNVTGVAISSLGGDDKISIGAGIRTADAFMAFKIDTGDGNDTVDGGDGDDTILCGAGNDTARGRGGNDSIDLGDGNDVGIGGAGDDSISGGTGNDRLFGELGNDRLAGDGGRDTIRGGAGDDTVEGGDDIDDLFGDAGNDLISGGTGNDRLSGDAGDDRLSGDGGRDSIRGGVGDDTMYGGDDNDVIGGDAGNDSATGGAGDDRLSGDAGDDRLAGDSGRDTIRGGLGDDTLDGGDDDDDLLGEAGNDSINGGRGRDRIRGGVGSNASLDDDGDIDLDRRGTGSELQFVSNVATVTGTSASKDDKRFFSFRAPEGAGTLSVVLDRESGDFADLEIEPLVGEVTIVKLEPGETSVNTASGVSLVAGQAYKLRVRAADRSPAGFKVTLTFVPQPVV